MQPISSYGFITSEQCRMKHFNERDVEIPALIRSLETWRNQISTLLDVGVAGTVPFYTKMIRNLMEGKRYDAVDVVDDPLVRSIVNNYYTGNVADVINNRYDYVSCLSTIEHAGVSPYSVFDYRAEQERVFIHLVRAAGKVLWMSFPFGTDDWYSPHYANIHKPQLDTWRKILQAYGLANYTTRFYYNEFAQGGSYYIDITEEEASKVPLSRELGVQCICILEAWR